MTVATTMWPDADLTMGPSVGDALESYVVLPSIRRPRLLVPVGNHAVTASAISRSSIGSGSVARLARGALASLSRLGILQKAPVSKLHVADNAGTGLVPWVAAQTTPPPIAMSIRLGSKRANQKPVAQLMTKDGSVTGYAKVGTNSLTRRLVAAEGATLLTLPRRPPGDGVVISPGVMVSGEWQGHQVLVLTPLAIPTMPRPASSNLLGRAITEIESLDATYESRLASAAYAHNLHHRAQAVSRVDGGRTGQIVDTLVQQHGESVLRFGSWHGDFRPWNVAEVNGRLLVWDWERCAPGVPVGLDAVHYHHPMLHSKNSPSRNNAAIIATSRTVIELLQKIGVRPDHLDALFDIHLLELTLRQLEDAATLPDLAVQAVGGANLAALTHRLGKLTTKH